MRAECMPISECIGTALCACERGACKLLIALELPSAYKLSSSELLYEALNTRHCTRCTSVLMIVGALVVTTLELPTESSSTLLVHRRFIFAANSAAWGGALEGIMYRKSLVDAESLMMPPNRVQPVRKAKK